MARLIVEMNSSSLASLPILATNEPFLCLLASLLVKRKAGEAGRNT